MLKRKMLVGFFVCMLLVSAFCMAVYAESYTLTATPTSCAPGDEIKVTVSGLTEEQINNGAWIAMYEEGARNSKYENYTPVSELPSDNSWKVIAPADNKKYCFKLFLNGDTENEAATSNWVTVGIENATFEVSAPSIHMEDKVSVKVGNIPHTDAFNDAWVGLYKIDAKDDQYELGKKIEELPGTGIWELNVPKELGKYEFRVFANNSYSLPMGKSAPFEVVLDTPVFKLEKTTYAIGEDIKVSFEKEPITDDAWIGFYAKNAKDDQCLGRANISELDKTKTFTVKASKSGEYDFRMFEDSGYILCGTSQTITVTDAVVISTPAPDKDNGATVVVPNLDQATKWAQSEIQEAYGLNLTTDKVLVDFQDPLTREEFCELSVKLYERMKGDKLESVSVNPFTDTTNPQILKAYKLGIVKGMTPTTFNPNANVTRAEIAVMLLRTLKCIMPDLDTNVQMPAPFKDQKDIASWATDAVKFFNSNDIIKGSNGYALPKANTTKEQGIALVKRVYNKFFDI